MVDANLIFERTPAAEWKAKGKTAIRFSITRIEESGANRIIERQRPYRPGARLESTGAKAKRWKLEAIFENTILEQGVSASSATMDPAVGITLYPDVLNSLLESFEVQETGDLTLPTRGVVRCRAESWNRIESDEFRDAAVLSLTFVEDNEERIGAQEFKAGQANANARRLAETTQFSAQSDGAWDTSLADLVEFASELEALANAPGDTVKDIDTQAGVVVGATNRVLDAFTDPSRDGRDVLNDPDSSTTQRKLHRTNDLAGRARARSRGGLPRLVTQVFPTGRSLFDIAASLEQGAQDLINANPALDPLFVPANTPVRVFE